MSIQRRVWLSWRLERLEELESQSIYDVLEEPVGDY